MVRLRGKWCSISQTSSDNLLMACSLDMAAGQAPCPPGRNYSWQQCDPVDRIQTNTPLRERIDCSIVVTCHAFSGEFGLWPSLSPHRPTALRRSLRSLMQVQIPVASIQIEDASLRKHSNCLQKMHCLRIQCVPAMQTTVDVVGTATIGPVELMRSISMDSSRNPETPMPQANAPGKCPVLPIRREGCGEGRQIALAKSLAQLHYVHIHSVQGTLVQYSVAPLAAPTYAGRGFLSRLLLRLLTVEDTPLRPFCEPKWRRRVVRPFVSL